jgi:hypothetical protein
MATIQLGVSRPIRRAGALLSRELYATILKEHQIVQSTRTCDEKSEPTMTIPFTIAMLKAREEALAAALARCLDQHDLGDLGVDKHRCSDPATLARCQEALAFRAEAEDIGMHAAGRVLLSSSSPDRFVPSQPLMHRLLEPTRTAKHDKPKALQRMILEME